MLADIVDRSVDRAVSRQVRPLLEAYEAADGRARLNDIAGGVGMIVGIAGIAMWAASRRRSRSAPTANET
jgi:nickel transport protein